MVTVVGKTFDQLVSNCPDNVHLEDYLTTFLYKFGRNEKQNNPFHRASLDMVVFINEKLKPKGGTVKDEL
ncbi:hypothetical protein HID58_025405 [Brassica napus]|uniref:Uncharacterized protein n=1 Tax=Brassica napus TaxID=3708 RepID=A0ABQ8CL18_BRANA|nr:hypothetical protein HID58_025405 [Brassica napus]